MALFMKQDFTPPILSRKWVAIKFRPNMLLHSRQHIISILESGLLFREDSIEVEQEAPSSEDIWIAAGGTKGGWFTRGEKFASVAAVCTCIFACPPTDLSRATLAKLAAYASIPAAVRVTHRRLSAPRTLRSLLAAMREYLALARRAAACLKENALMHAQLGSISSVIESMHTMLCRQQSELAVLMSRASSALLGNAPWLRGDLAWDVAQPRGDSLQKIHHTFLVVQSTLLKHIAMAHYIPSNQAQKIYKNHNERIYWIHTVLIEHLNKEFFDNYEALDRMYRVLKNYGNKDYNSTKTPGSALNDSWLYSDVHSGVARASLDLKLALDKCTNLDMFLDSCAMNKQKLDLDILNKDIDDLIDLLTKCLTTTQNSQIRLKKLQSKFGGKENLNNNTLIDKENDENEDVDENILKIEDKEPETIDEVFYFVKTDDDHDTNYVQPAGDVTTEPGNKEKETTKVVLKELKRKLVKREDLMRERERQALAKTMPELKNNIPEFPRQTKMEDIVDRKGYINKLKRKTPKCRLFKKYKISKRHTKLNPKTYTLNINKYVEQRDIRSDLYEANATLNFKSKLLTIEVKDKNLLINKWCKYIQPNNNNSDLDLDSLSEDLSDVEVVAINKNRHEAVNFDHNKKRDEAIYYKYTKRDLELSMSDSETDEELEERNALLNDVIRHGVVPYPLKLANSTIDNVVDESLKPIEYSFGTGMAMASVLQKNSNSKLPTRLMQEEVFIGDGEVSDDSGNDEDA